MQCNNGYYWKDCKICISINNIECHYVVYRHVNRQSGFKLIYENDEQQPQDNDFCLDIIPSGKKVVF